MGRGQIASYYERLSPEDRRTFDRWLTANAIFSLIFAIGTIAMALAGSKSVGPGEAVATSTSLRRCHVGSAAQARFESAAGAPKALARMFEETGLSRGRVAREAAIASNRTV
jgi:hypothetical protein